ncbi:MAG TPA: gliding motility lipoprotein GldH [Paludibacter sp.]|nr:gliding motility lipoprotein GldH [Paludibacter sp.]
MKLRNFAITVFFIFIFISCSQRDVYLQFSPVNEAGWSKDSLFTFDIPVSDTQIAYNLYVNIRNRGEYPYQNLWLFLEKMTPDSVVSRDTIEFYLADNHGKWLGTGAGATYEMPVLYQQNIKFTTTGTYRYKISQGMRDSVLAGINDIGMRLEKTK